VIFHNFLQKYLQPGGHLEASDNSLIEAAQREIFEETGLKNFKLDDWCLLNQAPILIDTHKIPANEKKNEAEHFHHDFMFIFHSDDSDINLQIEEVSSFNWVNVQEIIKNNPHITRALNKIDGLNKLKN